MPDQYETTTKRAYRPHRAYATSSRPMSLPLRRADNQRVIRRSSPSPGTAACARPSCAGAAPPAASAVARAAASPGPACTSPQALGPGRGPARDGERRAPARAPAPRRRRTCAHGYTPRRAARAPPLPTRARQLVAHTGHSSSSGISRRGAAAAGAAREAAAPRRARQTRGGAI